MNAPYNADDPYLKGACGDDMERRKKLAKAANRIEAVRLEEGLDRHDIHVVSGLVRLPRSPAVDTPQDDD